MNKINFTNLPSTTTPLNATNMNQLQTNVDNAKVEKCISISSTDLNTLVDTAFYYCSSCTNRPMAKNGYLRVMNLGTNYCIQEYFAYNSAESYIRRLVNGTWEDWGETTSTDNGWQNLTLLNDYGRRSNQNRPQYRKIGNVVYLKGLVYYDSTSSTHVSEVAQLPSGYRPTTIATNANLYFTVRLSTGTVINIQVNAEGYIMCTSTAISTGNWFSLDGINFPIG